MLCSFLCCTLLCCTLLCCTFFVCCRIALELLKDADGALKLTRRLSIICLEDGLLHPQLPLVVWTMMALVGGTGVTLSCDAVVMLL